MKKILMVGVLAFAGMFLSGKAHAWQSCKNVVVGMAPGGNGVASTPIYEQRCVWLAGAVAVDPATRAYSSAWNYQNPDEALAYVVAQCGRQCVGQSFFEDFAYVAISEDDRAWGISMVSAGDAVRQCQASGNPGCVAVIGASSSAAAVYWFYGAVAYDADTGASGSSWNQLRRLDAEVAAKKGCGSENCWAYVFQGGKWRHCQEQGRQAVRCLVGIRARIDLERQQGGQEILQKGYWGQGLRGRHQGAGSKIGAVPGSDAYGVGQVRRTARRR